MKKLKGMSELGVFIKLARDQGYAVKPSKAGGGWVKVAIACGADDVELKIGAKEFLRKKFGGMQVAQPARKLPSTPSVTSKSFLESFEWRRLRMEALKKYSPRCMCCGATPKDGAVMNVDHIKPRKIFPNLALDINNLQILCHECNHGKGNWDQTDWRG